MPTTRKSKSKPARKAAPRKREARRSDARLTAALAEAAWAEADAALAEALVEFDALTNAADRTARAEAVALLGQALSRAARKRGLTRHGKIGALESYDPKVHLPARTTSRAPKSVRIVTPGVVRGGEVLVKARVGGARAKRR